MIPLGILASSIRITLPDALLAPTNLASSLVGGLVKLTWTDRNTDETGHRIYRSSSPMDTQALPPPVAELGPDVTEWEDTGTPVDQETYYIVSAVRGAEEAFSDEVMIDTTTTEEDPYWNNVVALLHFDGGFTDETGRVWDQTGEFLTSGDEKVFGSASAYFPPTGLRGLTTSPTPDLNLGGDDFTVECWINPRIRNRQLNICALYGYSFNRRSWDFLYETNDGGLLKFRMDNDGISPVTDVASATMGTGMLNKWTHVAVTRNGNVFRMFFDGVIVSEGTYNISAFENLIDPVVFGTSGPNIVNSWDGYIDEFRITKGVARYTENFPPPTEPFPNQ